MGRFVLQDKVVVITGASQGIGKALAACYAREGARVVLAARSADKLEQLASMLQEQGHPALAVPTDVTVHEQVQALVDKASEHFGQVDIMVLNAGMGVLGHFDQLTIEDWRRQFEVNFWGVLYGIYAVLPQMQKRGSGQLILLNSINGKLALPLAAPYCATKFALTALADAIRPELARDGIDVIAIYPGFVKTAFQANIQSRDLSVPADWARRMRGTTATRLAQQIVKASRQRKPELILTISGRWGIRLAHLCFWLGRRIRAWSLPITERMIAPRKPDA